MLRKFLFAPFLMVLALPSFSGAWEGKVIGVKDCGTIIVFDGTNPPVSVHLQGIYKPKECPQGARQFVLDSAFGKKVEVKDEKKTDDGVIAEAVMPDGKSLNKELLRQDFMRNAGRPVPAAVSPKPAAALSPAQEGHRPAPSSASQERVASPVVGQDRKPSSSPGVRKWKDKDGNIHFSGTVN